MIVYSYHPESLEFAGVTDAFESPLEAGVFLYPANTTEKGPPTFDEATHSCKFVEGSWVVAKLVVEVVPEEIESVEVRIERLLRTREAELRDTDWVMHRHQEEKLLESATTLTDEQIVAIAKYRQQWRDMPNLPAYPYVDMPTLRADVQVEEVK